MFQPSNTAEMGYINPKSIFEEILYGKGDRWEEDVETRIIEGLDELLGTTTAVSQRVSAA